MIVADWTQWLGWLAAETTALVAVAAIFDLCVRTPGVRRTLWRAALTTVALVWMVELSGLREKIARANVKRDHFVITAAVLPVSVAHMKAEKKMAGEEIADLAAPLAVIIKWPAWVWLGGSMLLLARFGLARVWLALRRRASAPAGQDSRGMIERWQTAFGLRRVESQIWPGLRGPVAFGVLRPTIALPSDFAVRFSAAEREAMLAHEMAHLGARDPFWWMVSDAVIALAWWHPLVWWARRRLQSANEAAADEASVLIPGGAHALAECLVRLGRELTAPGPARALGIGGNGPRSRLAARIERLLRGPRAWQPLSRWARWMPQVSAVFVAAASALLPIQTGLSGSILAVLASAPPAHAETPLNLPPPAAITNQSPVPEPPAPLAPLALVPQTIQATEPKPVVVASLSPANIAEAIAPSALAPSILVNNPLLREARTNPPAKVSLVARFVSLREDRSDSLGLDWIFGQEPTNNPVVETRVSHDWADLQPFVCIGKIEIGKVGTNISHALAHPVNLTIDRLRTEGQSAVLKPEQFAALLRRIEQNTGADILSAPRIVTFSGRQAHVTEQTLQTVVTGVQATNGPAGQGNSVCYCTDNIASGLSIDIIPTLEKEGRWSLAIMSDLKSFTGYDDYGHNKGSHSAPGGKPLIYEVPHLHFRMVEANTTEDSLLLGQTLALRGPMETEVTKTKRHFLVPAKTTTIRQRLYVFVTATEPTEEEVKE